MIAFSLTSLHCSSSEREYGNISSSGSASDFFSSPSLHCSSSEREEGKTSSSDFASIVFAFPSLHSPSTETSDDSDDSISGQSWDDDCGSKSSTTNESHTDGQKERNVEKESRYAFFLRLGVVSILILAAAAAVSVIVYDITDTGEMDSFESEYEAAAEKVTGELTKYHLDAMLSAAVAGSLTIINPFVFDHKEPFWVLPKRRWGRQSRRWLQLSPMDYRLRGPGFL
jgi:hypothetical protein